MERETPAARRGTAVHWFLQQCAEFGREAVLDAMRNAQFVATGPAGDTPLGALAAKIVTADMADALPVCEAIDLTALPVDPGRFWPEAHLGWNPATGQAFLNATRLARDCFFTGRADVVGVDQEKKVGYVGDFKGHITKRAADSWQLRSLALMLARAYDLDSVVVQLIQPGEEGETFTSTATLDAAELGATEGRLRDVFKTIHALRLALQGTAWDAAPAPVSVFMGEHCRFCPAFQHCPGKQALVRQLVLDPAVVASEVKALVTPENAGLAHWKLKQIEQLVDVLRESLNAAVVEFGGVVLPDGKVYAQQEYDFPVFDGDKAYDALKDAFGADLAAEATELTTTKKRIEDVARAMKARGEGCSTAGANVDALLDILRDTGALTYEKRKRFGERKR